VSAPLLTTKLYVPSPSKHLVERPHLLEKLKRCLEPDCRLALISAPAGFGKSTLVSAWLAATKPRAAWLSIDQGDNDPVIFWSYVITALQNQQEGIGQKTLDFLAAPEIALEQKLGFLINDLAQFSHPLVLVLDDYHFIRSPQIHQSLVFFIEHVPANIHLLIASRTDPPLPLALLRGQGRLLEIRLNDLRFSDQEADLYLNTGSELNLSAQSVQVLNAKTEGWVTGLQLAALAMQDAAIFQKCPEFVTSFSGSNRFILDYLMDEVLNRQPEPIQYFLSRTSILEQLCAPLCDALLFDSEIPLPTSQELLLALENANLFIFPLDQQRYWYRYHHLFADLLRKHLLQTAPEKVQQLQQRAVAWYEQNGLIPNAIQHAFQLQDYSKAAALVAQVIEAMWGRGEHTTLLAWLDALPDAEKLRYPHLLTFQVSMLINARKIREAEACVQVLEQHLQDTLTVAPAQPALIAAVAELRTYIASFRSDWPVLFAQAETALQNLTRIEHAGQRCGVCLILGNAHLIQGRLETAGTTFAEAIAAGQQARKPYMTLSGIANLSMVLWFQGKLNRAAQICQEGLQQLEHHGFHRSPMAADLWLVWGAVLCEHGLLADAQGYLRQALELAQEQQLTWQIAWGHMLQARLHLALGDLEQAEIAARAAATWGQTHEIPAHFSCAIFGFLAEIWLRQGKTAQAQQYLLSQHVLAAGALHFPHQPEHLAWARLKWLQGNQAEADSLLERIIQGTGVSQQTGILISALILRALLFHTPEDPKKSLSFLERALNLAGPEGYNQVFIDEGPIMAGLLQKALKQGIQPEFVQQLLAAFPSRPIRGTTVSSPKTQPASIKSASVEGLSLIVPLSRREMETLQLIAEGCSNKEIAQKLCVSLRTVKFYSTGLYNKLNVESRMQAVIRARELGLL
jgi:LuxR family maltose regulon positive regulatory protein